MRKKKASSLHKKSLLITQKGHIISGPDGALPVHPQFSPANILNIYLLSSAEENRDMTKARLEDKFN